MDNGVDVLIIGSGCAGLTASIYCARGGLNTLVITGDMRGGQLTLTSEVENYPGFAKPIDAKELIEQMTKQSISCGAKHLTDSVKKLSKEGAGFVAETKSNGTLFAKAVVIATGSSVKWLGIESEKKYMGAGVSSCAICDGAFYKGDNVAVIGGGNSAVEEAIYLSKIAKKVYLVHRRDSLRASDVLQKRMFSIKNIEPVWNYVVKEINGANGFVNGLELKSTSGEGDKKIDITGVFIAIGHVPNSHLFSDIVETLDNGYIKVFNNTETNVPGIFVAGDVGDSVYRQAVTAAASGCKSALDAMKYLEANI